MTSAYRRQNVGGEGVEVNERVDASGSKGAHAARVVGVGINVVDTDRVGAESLHERRIARALVAVDQRVVFRQLVSNAFAVLAAMLQGNGLGRIDSVPLMKNWVPFS